LCDDHVKVSKQDNTDSKVLPLTYGPFKANLLEGIEGLEAVRSKMILGREGSIERQFTRRTAPQCVAGERAPDDRRGHAHPIRVKSMSPEHGEFVGC
jgi:hypothetical protein